MSLRDVAPTKKPLNRAAFFYKRDAWLTQLKQRVLGMRGL